MRSLHDDRIWNEDIDRANEERKQSKNREDQERSRLRQAEMSNVIVLLDQRVETTKECASSWKHMLLSNVLVLDVSVANATREAIVELSLDALWLTGKPAVFGKGGACYDVMLCRHVTEGVPDRIQCEFLGPREKWSESRNKFVFRFKWRSHERGRMSVRPIGDISAVVSFTDNRGQRWQRIGNRQVEPLEDPDSPPPIPSDGVIDIWSCTSGAQSSRNGWSARSYWDPPGKAAAAAE